MIWMKILSKMNETMTITKVSKVTDLTIASTFKHLNKMELAGLVTSKRHGRERPYTVTEKGLEILKNMGEIKWMEL